MRRCVAQPREELDEESQILVMTHERLSKTASIQEWERKDKIMQENLQKEKFDLWNKLYYKCKGSVINKKPGTLE